ASPGCRPGVGRRGQLPLGRRCGRGNGGPPSAGASGDTSVQLGRVPARLARQQGSRVMRPSFNIGIEEEYQTIDPETRDLRSHIDTEIIQKGKLLLYESVKAEMHQSVVEVGTCVCKNIKEAKKDVRKLRGDMIG